MSRIRDIASILTAANVLSTDVETSAAITAAINALPPGYGRGNTASRPVSPTVGDIYVNTQTGFVEIYESTGWSQVGGAASVVTGVTATNTPTSRAYNNGSASIAFTPGTILGKTYTVTSSPGSYTASGSVSPITITGLQSSTQYTYTIVASNNYGTASASSASSAVTATTVPQAPSITSVTEGNAQVSVAFSANATGGSSITGYTITSSPGNITASGSSSPIIVTGLTNDTAYTFTAVATNANGTSTASSASSSVTPISAVVVDLLVVAGGAGGGSDRGGGGGAGGLRYASRTLIRSTNYTVTVGGGGNGSNNGNNGGVGVNSSVSGTGITTLTASGGGYGAGCFNSGTGGVDGGSGGSGGGGGGHLNITRIGGSGNSGNYTPVEGYAGGSGVSGNYNSGGGGGAGAAGATVAGSSTSSNPGGDGGVGSSSYSSFGVATSSGHNVNGTYYYAGGGGGGSDVSGRGGMAGLGGGGDAARPRLGSTSTNAIAGTANTGGGGGGSTNSGAGDFYEGKAGGSGIIILRYTGSITASSTTGSPTRYETGGYTYYKFTGTGSITF